MSNLLKSEMQQKNAIAVDNMFKQANFFDQFIPGQGGNMASMMGGGGGGMGMPVGGMISSNVQPIPHQQPVMGSLYSQADNTPKPPYNQEYPLQSAKRG